MQALSGHRFPGRLSTLMASASLLRPAAKAKDHRHPVPARSNGTASSEPRVGIALGAGGANGLAHILMLEALDELSVTLQHVAGSSIGAIIGALYASGMTGKEIRELVEQFIITPGERLVEELLNKDALRWVEFIEIDLGKGGLLNSEGFISFLYDTLEHDTFEALDIPFKVTAVDMRARSEVVLDSGPQASSLPALPREIAPEAPSQPRTSTVDESGDRRRQAAPHRESCLAAVPAKPASPLEISQ